MFLAGRGICFDLSAYRSHFAISLGGGVGRTTGKEATRSFAYNMQPRYQPTGSCRLSPSHNRLRPAGGEWAVASHLRDLTYDRSRLALVAGLAAFGVAVMFIVWFVSLLAISGDTI